MQIASIRHKALKQLFLEGRTKGVIEPQRLIDMLVFIVAAEGFERLADPPNFGFHALTGDRKGSFAMAVTRNWRLTFAKVDDVTVGDFDLEDYH